MKLKRRMSSIIRKSGNVKKALKPMSKFQADTILRIQVHVLHAQSEAELKLIEMLLSKFETVCLSNKILGIGANCLSI